MIRLAIRCRAEDAERVLAELLELAPGGIEEEQGEGWVEYAVYGPPGEIPELPDVAASAADGPIEVSTTEIPDDWADRWRDFHKPIAIDGGRMVVRPSWEEADPARREARPATDRPATDRDTPGRIRASSDHRSPSAHWEDVSRVDVVIDPGQAFGTGAHATTRMCLELLLQLADEGHATGPLVDLGTGSGVLAIAAAKLGWGPVSGYDSESAALEAAAENAAANGVALELSRANLRRERAPVAPTIVANLTAPLLNEVAVRMAPAPPPERLVCSGLLADEVDAVVGAFAAASLTPRATRVSGEWAAICFAAT